MTHAATITATIIVCAYEALLLGLSGAAGCVAIFVDDKDRRADAYRVLKLLLVTGGVGGVLAAFANQLQRVGALL